MGGSGVVEGVSVLLLVGFEDVGVNSETGFLCEPSKLSALGFEVAEVVSVPGGGVGVGDGFGYSRGEVIETGGECGVIAVYQFSGGGVLGGRVVGDGVSQQGGER